ncbi:ATP-binding protein [Cohnella hashimotonis]|uniref:ATP-binding protein n=1 Tax=Cohnella hashimotonis TaxID=2826895 RepID=A0ABT6TFY3_9BACL|nr:ATP-binding protein [Cohnella hashimotonis]MDI4645659.1 ATP-binding protein [Cohnella hashimotonis]
MTARNDNARKANEADGSCAIALNEGLSAIGALHRFMDETGVRLGWSERMKLQLTLACEELLTNIVSYGYPDGGDPRILLTIDKAGGGVRLVMEDNAASFDPLSKSDPDLTQELDDRQIGGLGVYFVKRLMDELSYERLPSGNRLTMIKYD